MRCVIAFLSSWGGERIVISVVRRAQDTSACRYIVRHSSSAFAQTSVAATKVELPFPAASVLVNVQDIDIDR